MFSTDAQQIHIHSILLAGRVWKFFISEEPNIVQVNLKIRGLMKSELEFHSIGDLCGFHSLFSGKFQRILHKKVENFYEHLCK